MNIKKHIPNFLTCCNLLCGCYGILAAFYSPNSSYLVQASFFIFFAAIFDFFDGFAARLLKVSSPIGKELDSLADVVSFGLLPGVIIFKLLEFVVMPNQSMAITNGFYLFIPDERHLILPFPENFDTSLMSFHPYIESIAFIIPIFSALRLAKFNIDTRQSESFIGVPTPTNAILIASFPLILRNSNSLLTSVISNPLFLIVFSIIMSLLLVAELPLFALKFKNFSWVDNKLKFILLISAVVLLILLQWAAIPLIIFLYILLSVIENSFLKVKS